MLESTLSLTRPQARVFGFAGDAALLGVTALFVALTFVLFGFWAFLGLAYALIAAWAVVHPQSFLLALLGAMIAVDPGVTSTSSPLSLALYTLPPGADALIPYTVSPLEIALVIATASLVMRVRTQAVRLPAMVWAVPVVVAAGVLYGISKGAPANLAYIEARGFIFGAVIFVAALKMRHASPTWAIRAIVIGTTVLSVVILSQSSALSGASQDLAFAHEGVALLAIGMMLGAVLFLRADGDRSRLLIVGYELLLLAAMGSTGRRSATLVVLAAIVIVLALLFVKRPALALVLTFVGSVALTGYLGAYWNQEYGALAQPARAMRGLFDDSAARDVSSDTYRDYETDNVLATISVSRNFGVGFGQEFAFFWPLPDLTEFWPLQHFTPHNNVLWLWLKMGIVGVSVVLGVWMLALSRCIRAVREAPHREFPVVPVALAATLAIMFSYNLVDIGLASTRGIAPIAIAVALSFALPTGSREPVGEATNEVVG
jgi:hypothetical protein